MLRRWPLLAAVLAVGATGWAGTRPAGPAPVAPLGPRAAAFPDVDLLDTPGSVAGKIARYMEARWPRVRIWNVNANSAGTVVVYAVTADYDRSIRDIGDYEAHVSVVSANLRQASVELLKLSARLLPQVRFASAWEESLLMAFWSRRQILHMGPAERYRDFHTFQRLVITAAIPPPSLSLARAKEGGGVRQSPFPG